IDVLLRRREARAAEFLGPAGAQPAFLRQSLLPVDQLLLRHVGVASDLQLADDFRRQVLLQPVAHLLLERELFLAERQLHGELPSGPRKYRACQARESPPYRLLCRRATRETWSRFSLSSVTTSFPSQSTSSSSAAASPASPPPMHSPGRTCRSPSSRRA